MKIMDKYNIREKVDKALHLLKEFNPTENALKLLSTVEQFVNSQSNENKLIFITSGGTSITLDPVRSLENFSSGYRGAKMAENFLRRKCSVIFLYRDSSRRPFMEPFDAYSDSFDMNKHVKTLQENSHLIQTFKNKTLLLVPYNTLDDYLHLLTHIAFVLSQTTHLHKPTVILAAAVSDFYLPHDKQWKDKIESSSLNNQWTIELVSVPKMMKSVIEILSGKCFVVSFKLDTNDNTLLKKAIKAFNKNEPDICIANNLHKRRHEIFLVTKCNHIRLVVIHKLIITVVNSYTFDENPTNDYNGDDNLIEYNQNPVLLYPNQKGDFSVKLLTKKSSIEPKNIKDNTDNKKCEKENQAINLFRIQKKNNSPIDIENFICDVIIEKIYE